MSLKIEKRIANGSSPVQASITMQSIYKVLQNLDRQERISSSNGNFICCSDSIHGCIRENPSNITNYFNLVRPSINCGRHIPAESGTRARQKKLMGTSSILEKGTKSSRLVEIATSKGPTLEKTIDSLRREIFINRAGFTIIIIMENINKRWVASSS
jgi:hypothetical protein